MTTGDAVDGRSSRTGRIHAPFAQPGAGRPARVTVSAAELPSIQDFLDELPSIDDYIWAGDSQSDRLPSIDEYLEDSSAGMGEIFAEPAQTDFDDAGWAIADWQSFDWNGAAMLGSRAGAEERDDRRGRADASSGTTGDRSGLRETTPSADEVARALDGIAQRIRSGELLIDQLTGAPPEAAMAAALAALLRMRG